MGYEQFTYDGSLQDNAMELREYLELDLEEMSERTGFTAQTLQMFENGEALTTSPMIEAAYYNQMVLTDLEVAIGNFLKDALAINPELWTIVDKYELDEYVDEEENDDFDWNRAIEKFKEAGLTPKEVGAVLEIMRDVASKKLSD